MKRAACRTQSVALVVDDAEVLQRVLGIILGQLGWSVVATSSGEDALDLLHSRTFDLVLLDRMLPGLSGDDTLMALRHLPNGIDMPVVLMSGDPLDSAAALAMGADACLSKPVNITALSRAIETAMIVRRRG